MEREYLSEKIRKYNELYIANKKELEILENQKEELLNTINDIEKERIDILTEKTLLEDSSKKARGLAKEVMEDIATNSLRAVFEDDREIVINLDVKAGQPTAELLMMQDGTDTDPAKEEGGGIADIVSLAMFLALNSLNEKNYAPVSLDEPNKFLSTGYSEKMAEFLRSIQEYTGRQMFLVTHDEHLKTIGDKSFKLTKVGKTSQVEYLD